MNALITVIIIILILGLLAVGGYFVYVFFLKPRASKPNWIREDNTTYVYGKVRSKSDSADGTIKYLGEYKTQDECEKACENNSTCKGYTWIKSPGLYINQCFGVTNIGTKRSEEGKFSGYLKERAA